MISSEGQEKHRLITNRPCKAAKFIKMTNSNIYVAFHIGRGGLFNNQGHKTFIGEMTFAELVHKRSEYLFEHNKDAKGKFCKPFLHSGDPYGLEVTTDDYKNGLTGKLNFDWDYDSDIVKDINDCSENELEIIAESTDYKSYDLINFLETYNEEWKFDRFGTLLS